jgi:5-methylcytosine-specific restriction endonuclease McrA
MHCGGTVVADPLKLPAPDSEQIAALVGSTTQGLLYGFLYRRRDNPPTMDELRFFVANSLGEDQSHTERRVSELRRYFEIEAVRIDNQSRYVLQGWSATRPLNAGAAISLRRRAEVLMPQRCAQCGRKPLEDHVKLVVDHKVPLSWGGDNESENLQPLCEECSAGKRDYFRSFEAHAEQIRAAIGYDEPQKRIGELLRAFDGGWVRSDLLGIVASAKNFQEDWQRRMRDLRFLGWDYEHEKRYDEGLRVWTYYRLTKSAAWPENIPQAIRAEEAKRKSLKKQLSAGPH